MNLNYPNCYKLTRQWEGGNDDDPRDPGGRTSRGIIQREYDKYRESKRLMRQDVFKASEDEIAEIYRRNYWDAILGDDWPEGCDLVTWDCAVNSGPGRAKSIAKAALPASSGATFGALAATARAMTDRTVYVKGYCARRLAFLRGLRTFATFGRGWSSRVASVEANGVKMVLNAQRLPPAEVKAKLTAESNAATAKARSHAGATVASSGGGGVGAGKADWHAGDWASLGGKIAVTAVVVIAVLYFFHWWRAHRARAQAYAAVAANGD